jgi:hypothetical protein
MGRVLLASRAPGRIAELLRQIKLNQLTEKSVTDAVQLRKLLALVRQQRYSIVDEEMMFGSAQSRFRCATSEATSWLRSTRAAIAGAWKLPISRNHAVGAGTGFREDPIDASRPEPTPRDAAN